MLRTSHPYVFRRAARAKRSPADRGFVPLRWTPYPAPGDVDRLFREAQRLRRLGR